MSSLRSTSSEERILVFAPSTADASLIRVVLDQAALAGRICDGIEELCQEAEAGAGAALLAEEVLDPNTMRRLVDLLGRQPPWSDFPLVVLFRNVGQDTEVNMRMLDLLEPLGNVAVVERPAGAMTLASALRSALRARQRQYQVRDLLAQRDRQVRHREHFLNLLAHELRNSFNTILHANQILDQIGSRANSAVEQRGIIARHTARLGRLTDDMVDVYRVLAGKLVLQRVPVDLRELVGRCLATVAPEVDAQRQQLALSAGDDALFVEGDARRLEQIVTHLLTNAVRYTPSGGRIELSLGAEDGEAVIRVRDTGIGLSPELLRNLFDQFAEVGDLPDDRPEGGLRMGLTLVRHLVKMHGGRASASSAGPNQGSELVVRLPLRAAPIEPATAPTATPRVRSAPRRILLIEDNPDSRETLQLMLQLWGYQVETAENGTQGVQKALARHPQVALVDIGLPGMDGYQVARELRAALGAGIFLVAMTGFGQPHDRRRALESGFDTHLVKPVDPDVLQELLMDPDAVIGEQLA